MRLCGWRRRRTDGRSLPRGANASTLQRTPTDTSGQSLQVSRTSTDTSERLRTLRTCMTLKGSRVRVPHGSPKSLVRGCLPFRCVASDAFGGTQSVRRLLDLRGDAGLLGVGNHWHYRSDRDVVAGSVEEPVNLGCGCHDPVFGTHSPIGRSNGWGRKLGRQARGLNLQQLVPAVEPPEPVAAQTAERQGRPGRDVTMGST
jgi:hypothetical protein